MEIADIPAAGALAVAAAAGLVSFLSPCVAPLVPGYLAFVSADSPTDPRTVRRTLAFVAGFATVFTTLGLGAAAVTQALLTHRAPLELAGGMVVGLMGLSMVAGRSVLPQTGAVAARLRRPGTYLGAACIGAAFSLVWTPCIGPVLAAILALAGSGAQPAWGASLLLAYSLGLGIPFVLAASSVGRLMRTSARLRRHLRRIHVASGVALIALGLFMASGQMSLLTGRLARVVPPLL